jgi:hypothetical protein
MHEEMGVEVTEALRAYVILRLRQVSLLAASLEGTTVLLVESGDL